MKIESSQVVFVWNGKGKVLRKEKVEACAVHMQAVHPNV